ncbi:alkaline phosphatase family protein [Thiotrichales bacterium 19S3-7]|nr:alkaline phosphatase family protein [Thiotrichales bacterium 19S3-7]MCF6801032.1 alkaline phosphatase family protein [Thiotrichales bacterium 19S3-11]
MRCKLYLRILVCICIALVSLNKIVYSSSVKPNVIIFVWDGLRPDAVSLQTTPNLYHLAKKGVWFKDNHSSYPTFTMMNASTFATGDFAGKTGFFGNTLWQPTAKGNDAFGKEVDFRQPVFTEDYQILTDLNQDKPLVEVETLFQLAHQKGLSTATVGKSGPAFFQDYKKQGTIFDENVVYPKAMVLKLFEEGYPLPHNILYAYPDLKLSQAPIAPSISNGVKVLADGVTSNPSLAMQSPYNQDNTYLMNSYLFKILPYATPRLSVIWLRNPDTTEHNYGVGGRVYFSALANQDQLLGKLIKTLKQNGSWAHTNLIIVSDHAHSNVSGPLDEFPLRNINQETNTIGKIDANNGFSVSGDFRPADLLSRAGFKAYDGAGCEYDPILSGVKGNGQGVYRVKVDTKGIICDGDIKVVDNNGHRANKIARKYTTPAYYVPKVIPDDAVIVAANGGSSYFYVPSHNKALVKKLVRFMQSREEFGAIFISQRYGDIAGTLPLTLVKLENSNHRSPDIIVGNSFDATAKVQGYNGTEFNSGGTSRGMHGSFSPVDVHNTLIAYGPSFKSHFIDTLPSGNVDVVPTVAYLLGLNSVNTDGRVLLESLKNGKDIASYRVIFKRYQPKRVAKDLTFYKATNPDNVDRVKSKSKYTIYLDTKALTQNHQSYIYFDQANAIRY